MKELTDSELLREFEYTIRWWHYCPGPSKEPKYSMDDLEAEVLERMSHE